MIPAGVLHHGLAAGGRPLVPRVRGRNIAFRDHRVSPSANTRSPLTQWDACVAAGGCSHRPGRPRLGAWRSRPVINVSWNDAQDVCEAGCPPPPATPTACRARPNGSMRRERAQCRPNSQLGRVSLSDQRAILMASLPIMALKQACIGSRPCGSARYPANPWGLA